MSEESFFQEIVQTSVPWRQYQLSVPVFYHDIAFMPVSMLAPTEAVG